MKQEYSTNVHLNAMMEARKVAMERREHLNGSMAGFVALLAVPLVLIGYFVLLAFGLTG